MSNKEHPYHLYALGGKTAAIPPEDPLAGNVEIRGPGTLPAAEAAHSLIFCRDGVHALAGRAPTDTELEVPKWERSAKPGVLMPGSIEDCAKEGGAKAATDAALRCVASRLLHADPFDFHKKQDDERLVQVAQGCPDQVAAGLVFLRNRIQVPRDMSHAAAATLRSELLAAATTLVGEEKAHTLATEHRAAFVSRRDIRSRF